MAFYLQNECKMHWWCNSEQIQSKLIGIKHCLLQSLSIRKERKKEREKIWCTSVLHFSHVLLWHRAISNAFWFEIKSGKAGSTADDAYAHFDIIRDKIVEFLKTIFQWMISHSSTTFKFNITYYKTLILNFVIQSRLMRKNCFSFHT